ncbi:Uncharacterised protein [Mesomycoplasma dispar]|uniref:Uncharacterized protein n=1 Tax=Mesomycoplasma dispar TaxID=86660 RepID=A0AAJ5NLJ2_9BACT|nr:hypothetical protein [Mesomycoplasma dispar]AJR12568.1 hypothetical protein MDIS_02525 [Mesomycoplasma dispar]VEU61990.1 Uncharacterised protein [Mesomycoplasma dispar]
MPSSLLIFIPLLTFVVIAAFNIIIWFKVRANYYFRNVFRRIKLLNKELDSINCNLLFKKGLSQIGKIVRKNNKYLLFNLIFTVAFSVSEFVIFWVIFFDPKDLYFLIFVLGLLSFAKFLFAALIFGTVFVSKKMIKTAEIRIQKWNFDSKSFYFDREYHPNNKKTKNLIAFVNPGQREVVFSSDEFRKYLKGYGLDVFYLIIWGIHFPSLKNVKFESVDIYQDFVNLYKKSG